MSTSGTRSSDPVARHAVVEGMTDRLATWHLPAVHPVDVDLPEIADVDVLVVGAGAAGVAAAVTCAEAGLKVVIVEKYGFAGGAAVAGMSGTICGLYTATSSGRGQEQVVAGFAERFRAGLAARGGLTEPQLYGRTLTVAHDPLVWRELADDLLARSGVRVLFHTTVTSVLLDDAGVAGVVVASTAGRAVVRARRTIDASGDAAVVARAGGGYHFGDRGRIQNPTMFFRLGGVDTARFWAAWGEDTISPDHVTAELRRAREEGADLPRQKIWVFATPRPGELLVNATRLEGPDGRMLNVVDPEDFTEAEIRGRRQVRAYADFLAASLDGCRDAFVVDTGVEAGIRQTRSITGVETLTNDDVVGVRKRADGICRSPWPIELHDGERPRLQWLLDDFYEVPYLSLVPAGLDGVVVAGRCLSAEHEALASGRVTAQCFEYGHAAAVATVRSLADGLAFRDVDGTDVRRDMIANGSSL